MVGILGFLHIALLLTLKLLIRLSKDEGDKAIERRLQFEELGEVTKKNLWLCTVYTSDIANGGTDAEVSMIVYGSKVRLRSDSMLLSLCFHVHVISYCFDFLWLRLPLFLYPTLNQLIPLCCISS